MRTIYTIHVNGTAVYHGINAIDALSIIEAYQIAGERPELQSSPWVATTIAESLAGDCEYLTSY